MKNWYKTAITIREVIDQVSPNDRITMSKELSFDFIDHTGDQVNHMKPKGLWYAVGDEWLRFVAGEYSSGFSPHLFKIDINPSSMLMIHDDRSFLEFADKYRVKDDKLSAFMGKSGDTIMNIDWARVAQSYSGIEISPYMWRFRLSEHMWYYGWDVASGCIWGKDGIKDYNLLYRDIDPLSEKDNLWYEEEEEVVEKEVEDI